MQNKRNWQDEEWAHQGWSKMQDILAHEMPVKKKRRAIIWWWFGAAAGILFLLGIWLWPDRMSPLKDSVPMVQAQESEIEPNRVQPQDELTTAEKLTKNAMPSSEIPKKPMEAVEGKGENRRLSLDNQEVIMKAPPQNADINKSENAEREQKEPILNSEQDIWAQDENTTLSKSERLLFNSPLIPTKNNPVTYEQSKLKNTLLSSIPVKDTFQPRLSLELTSGVLRGIDSYQWALRGGVGLAFQFKPNWTMTLHTQLGRYRFDHLAFEAAYSDQNVEVEFPTSVFDPTNTNAQVDLKNVSYVENQKLSKSLIWLDIPLQLQYRLNDNWFFSGGVQYSRLVKITDPLSTALALSDELEANRDAQSSVILSDLSQYDLINKNQLSILGGIGWQHQRLSMTIQYQYGVSNLMAAFIQSDTQLRKQSLGLQAYYRF